MRGREPLGNMHHILRHIARVQSPLAHQATQRRSFEQLGDDVGETVGCSDVIHREDVLMIERRGGLGFCCRRRIDRIARATA